MLKIKFWQIFLAHLNCRKQSRFELEHQVAERLSTKTELFMLAFILNRQL